MKKIIVFTIAIAVFALLFVAGSVYAYQYGMRNNLSVDRQAVEDAIESGNYAAWKELHEGMNCPMMSAINETNFQLMQQMHEAMESGDFDRVREIRSELGMGNGYGRGMGMGIGTGQGMMRGMHMG